MTPILVILLAFSVPPDDPSPAELLGWPASLADEAAPGLQEQDRKNEFAINVNLWPILESTTLPTGERRTALWPLFHVSTNPSGSNHSWHVLTFLMGENYHMFLPLYYVVDDNVGILPPVYFGGRDYWVSVPLLSGSWKYADGDRATWVTPLFHLTTGADGSLRNLHALVYFEGRDSWVVPPLLTGSWGYPDHSRVTWVTPLFHYTGDAEGNLLSMHAGLYFQSPTSWSIPPILVWNKTYEGGTNATWVTPLFHWTQDETGAFLSTHVALYIQGRDYWMLPPLAGGGRTADGGSVTWITPLVHWTTGKDGAVRNYHAAIYFEDKDWWTIPPLLTYGWSEGKDWRMTTALLFWLHLHEEKGFVSSTLFPVYFWVQDDYWFVLPLVSGHWNHTNGGETTWLTPFFHTTYGETGSLESWHAGIYFQGEGYWAVPPLFSWHNHYGDGTDVTWLTPLFHLTLDPKGDFHSIHVGVYFQGEDYWAVPPLLSWHRHYEDGVDATWLTPLFHATTDAAGDLSSLHVFPLYFYARDKAWFVPPLLSGHELVGDYRHTFLTPLYHTRATKEGELLDLHLTPFYYWGQNTYWTVPLLMIGGGRHADDAESTWLTPLYHQTVDKKGDLESLHVGPAWFWKRDEYWSIPPLLTGGFTRPDGSHRTWITPLYHDDYTQDGKLISRHVLNYFDGDGYHTFFPIYWDWTDREQARHTMVPPVFVRTEEANGDTTTSLPWPIISVRSGQALDTSIGMELRPFLYQTAGKDHEFNFLWRIFSVLHEEESTRVMAGPLWHSQKPDREDAMTKFQILGGLFARDCNYETNRYRYRILWVLPLGANPMAP